MTWIPAGIDLSERFRTYVDQLRKSYDNHAEDGGNVHSGFMTEDTTDETASPTTYRDAYLEAAHFARPASVTFAFPLLSNTPMDQRAFLTGVGAGQIGTSVDAVRKSTTESNYPVGDGV